MAETLETVLETLEREHTEARKKATERFVAPLRKALERLKSERSEIEGKISEAEKQLNKALGIEAPKRRGRKAGGGDSSTASAADVISVLKSAKEPLTVVEIAKRLRAMGVASGSPSKAVAAEIPKQIKPKGNRRAMTLEWVG